jgi:hypothetical protein
MIDREVELIIKYSYPKLVMEEYFEARSLIFNNLAEEDIKMLKEEKKNALNKVINKISKRIIGSRQVIDGALKEDRVMPEEVQDIIARIKVTNQVEGQSIQDGFFINIPVKGYYCLLVQKQRLAVFEMYVNMDETTFIKVNRKLALYSEEDYSIALKKPDNSEGIAIVDRESATGIKGERLTLVTYFNRDYYYIDTLEKYGIKLLY